MCKSGRISMDLKDSVERNMAMGSIPIARSINLDDSSAHTRPLLKIPHKIGRFWTPDGRSPPPIGRCLWNTGARTMSKNLQATAGHTFVSVGGRPARWAVTRVTVLGAATSRRVEVRQDGHQYEFEMKLSLNHGEEEGGFQHGECSADTNSWNHRRIGNRRSVESCRSGWGLRASAQDQMHPDLGKKRGSRCVSDGKMKMGVPAVTR